MFIHSAPQFASGTSPEKTSPVQGWRESTFQHHPWVWATGPTGKFSRKQSDIMQMWQGATSKTHCWGDRRTSHIDTVIPFCWKNIKNNMNVHIKCKSTIVINKEKNGRSLYRLTMVVFAGAEWGCGLEGGFHFLHYVSLPRLTPYHECILTL